MNRGLGQPIIPTSFQVGLPPVGASGLWWVQARPGAGAMWNYFTTAADATNGVLWIDHRTLAERGNLPPSPTRLNVGPPPHQPSNTTGSWMPGPSVPAPGVTVTTGTQWIWYPETVVEPFSSDTAIGGNAVFPGVYSSSSQMVGGDGLTYSVYAQAYPSYTGPIDALGHPTAAPFLAPTSPPPAGNLSAIGPVSPARWLNPAPNYFIWVPGSATAPGVYTPPPVSMPGPGSGGYPYNMSPPPPGSPSWVTRTPAPLATAPAPAGPSAALVVVGLIAAAASILGIAYLATRATPAT